MNAMISLLFAVVSSILVLRSGERIAVDGQVRLDGGVALFRSGGALYSLPAAEIDAEATRAATDQLGQPQSDPRFRLKVSMAERDRLLRELENSHGGTAPVPQKSIENAPVAETPSPAASTNDEEWSWRRRARAHEESIRRAGEDLALLQQRAEELRGQVLGFLSLGYKPGQFTYQTTMLEHTLAAIPQAELEVQRAKRAFDQFRDDARRQGVLPGWLR